MGLPVVTSEGLVVAVKDDDTVAWFENDGGNFSSWPRSIIDGQAPDSVVHVHVADMDGDGDLDVVSSSNVGDTIAWYENDGAADPSWTSTNINTSLNSVKDFDVGDIDGDGDLDITLAYANKVVWFENDGAADPSWSDGILINASQPGAMAAYAVDMDYDGDLDVVTGGVLDIVWYKNDGAADPNWTATVVYNDTIHNNGLDFADAIFISGASFDQTENHKIAIRFKQNDMKVYIDGVSQSLNSSFVYQTISGLDRLAFNLNGISNTEFRGKIKQAFVFNTALTDTELQNLTS